MRILINAVALLVLVLSGCGKRVSTTFGSVSVVQSTPIRSEAIDIRFSPDSTQLMVAGFKMNGKQDRGTSGEYSLTRVITDKHLRLWDVASMKQIERLPAEMIEGEWNGQHALLMSDFKTLITSWGARNFISIDVRKRRRNKIIDFYNGYLGSMALSPNGRVLVLGMTREVQIRDAKTYRLLHQYSHGGQGTSVGFGDNSVIVQCSWPNSKPQYLNVNTGKQVRTPKSDRAFNVTFSPDGKYFAVTRRLVIELWQRKPKSRMIKTFAHDLVGIRCIQFSPDSKTLAVGGLSQTQSPVRFFRLP